MSLVFSDEASSSEHVLQVTGVKRAALDVHTGRVNTASLLAQPQVNLGVQSREWQMFSARKDYWGPSSLSLLLYRVNLEICSSPQDKTGPVIVFLLQTPLVTVGLADPDSAHPGTSDTVEPVSQSWAGF